MLCQRISSITFKKVKIEDKHELDLEKTRCQFLEEFLSGMPLLL